MYKAVKTVVAENATLWSGLPAFENVFNTFTQKLGTLEQHAYNQNLALVGVSAVKEDKRELVADKAHAISSSLMAFAVISNNVELINQMKISRNTLRRSPYVRALQLLDLIIAKATVHLNDLGDFGVEQAAITELQTLRDELEVLMNAPRNAIIERKVLTQQIKVITKEIDLLLKNQLDKLMVVLKEEQPDFFTAYRNARIIIDHKAHHSSGESEEGPAETPGYGE